MIYKSAAVKTLDEATAVLDDVKRSYQPKIEAGTLTESDRERIRRRLKLAADLEERSRSESSFSLLGDFVAVFKRFLRTGRWGMTYEDYKRELQELIRLAETPLTRIHEVGCQTEF